MGRAEIRAICQLQTSNIYRILSFYYFRDDHLTLAWNYFMVCKAPSYTLSYLTLSVYGRQVALSPYGKADMLQLSLLNNKLLKTSWLKSTHWFCSPVSSLMSSAWWGWLHLLHTASLWVAQWGLQDPCLRMVPSQGWRVGAGCQLGVKSGMSTKGSSLHGLLHMAAWAVFYWSKQSQSPPIIKGNRHGPNFSKQGTTTNLWPSLICPKDSRLRVGWPWSLR